MKPRFKTQLFIKECRELNMTTEEINQDLNTWADSCEGLTINDFKKKNIGYSEKWFSIQKRIRFFNDCDKQYILFDVEEIKEHFQEFINVDYESIKEYMTTHDISFKHKKLLQTWLNEVLE